MPVVPDRPQNDVLQREICTRCGTKIEFLQDKSVPGKCGCVFTINEQTEPRIHIKYRRDVHYNGQGTHEPAQRVRTFGKIEFKGSVTNHAKFVKEHYSTNAAELYSTLTEAWNLSAPNLVVTMMGGEGHFQMKPWLRDTVRKGLVKAAQSTGAWIVTNGLRFGVTRHVGEAVRDHSLASTSSKVKVIAIGITPLKMVHDRECLFTAKNDEPAYYHAEDLPHGPTYSLDSNHSHFILVEEDEQHPDGTTDLRIKLLKHISEQRTGYGGTGSIEIPVLCLLIHGDLNTLERIYRVMENSTPCLIFAGSGGIADVLASIKNLPCDTDTVQELLMEKFHSKFSRVDILRWTELIKLILEQQHLLTIHDPAQEGSEELDTVILKALVKACKSQSQEAQEYLDELKLAVAWNRVDIAKSEIFNGELEWRSCDLEEVMMDALVNDKPDFVKLFIDNGMNIYEFLTYGKLQELYCSIPQKCLLNELLSKKHEEHKLTIAARNSNARHDSFKKNTRYTLHEVSRVLKDFLDDSCRGFYQDTNKRGPLEKNIKTRMSHGQKCLPNLNQRCENPWRDLFLWAVLQNRQEMANYFWAMGPEAVAAALAGCKIMKEMTRLESEAESARSMKEAKYEQFALDMFSECYTNNEEMAFALLVRKTKYWSKTTCLNLATTADAKSFFAHDGVQALLTKTWWGAMTTDTRIWKLVLCFSCPPLIYTNLIKFSDEEQHSFCEPDNFKDPDSPDTEKSILLNERNNGFNGISENEKAIEGNNSWAESTMTRWRKFWSAPVTVFLGNVIMYFAFLILFTYVLLVDFQPPPPKGPSMPEFSLYFWVFTLVLEEIRQSFFTDEDTNILKKCKLYVEDNWNKCDMVAILLFLIGVICRMIESTYEAGRTVLALDFMVFTLRLIHIFAIHKQLGPKIIIVERMMKDVFFFLFFLTVWLIAYGVATQALLHPNEARVEWIFRRVLYRPYLHIFGQIPLEEIDVARMPQTNCSYNPIDIFNDTFPSCPNLYANWLVILLLVIFLLVTNVLLLNLLIAMFSYTFQVVQGNTDIFWKFQRYNLIVEYYNRPALAPPFIIINHLFQAVCSMFNKAESKQEHLERDLPEAGDQKLMTWETVQKENYLARLEKKKRESSEQRLKKTSNKVDALLKIFSGFKQQEKRLVRVETQLRYCSEVLTWLMEGFNTKRLPSVYSGLPYRARAEEANANEQIMDLEQTDLKYIDD
ncbi:transient receptor potential cation channel subfamily M member 5 [Erpetoichthys calabaricus]|uniref:transient receptor potential cation channel subfamily M member 5 n=1 Tax=Erpetoichthys calabaricus TaxID=27687 RepID=UPI0022346BE9|nr:transient receptor potential cation channel subfamily M member 5 [Erpetoichthys calabaricus]